MKAKRFLWHRSKLWVALLFSLYSARWDYSASTNLVCMHTDISDYILSAHFSICTMELGHRDGNTQVAQCMKTYFCFHVLFAETLCKGTLYSPGVIKGLTEKHRSASKWPRTSLINLHVFIFHTSKQCWPHRNTTL